MWHSISKKEVLDKLAVNESRGLSQESVRERLEENGMNKLPKGKRHQWWVLLLRQFRSPLVYILLIAALLTVWLALFPRADEVGIEKWVDTIVILLAVLMNVAVGFFQEFQSDGILKKLEEAVRTTALVLRDGHAQEISSEAIVPGDILILRFGEKVPADARVLWSQKLETNESALTGESRACAKGSEILAEDTVLAERSNMVFMGTTVARGEGRAVVVGTGAGTEFGKIAALTRKSKVTLTPLQLRMKGVGKFISILVGFATLIVFLIGYFSGHSFEQMFVTAIAVAVAAIPEGLPAAISIALAVSAQRILRKRGVVKQLMAAETLGSASVVCTDKTGTLTEGVMKVSEVYSESLDEAGKCMAFSNSAILEEVENGGTLIRGEMTDKAKMQWYLDRGGDLEKDIERFPRVAFLPFESERGFIASAHRSRQKNRYVVYVSGTPEEVLARSGGRCGAEGLEGLNHETREEIQHQYEKLAGHGVRVIALARKSVTFPAEAEAVKEIFESPEAIEKNVNDLEFLGLTAIHDPVREDVFVSIKTAREAGVRVIMLTGDHILTARAIGRKLGFRTGAQNALRGVDLDKLSDEELESRIKKIDVYARVTPEHKIRIVHILQKMGEVVAMTGDGVNDAPALKGADIGISVQSGTDIAKEASDLVLLDNSFSVIVTAIRQGRIAFDNIRKVAVFLFSGSFSELILILLSLIFRLPLPITAVQILWANLVEDSLPNVALAFEPGDKDTMKRRPRSRNEPIIDREAKAIIFIVGILTDLLIFALFLFLYYFTSYSLPYIQTFIFATLGVDTFFYVYSIKSLRSPIYSYSILSNKLLVLATGVGLFLMLAAIYLPFLNTLLGTVPLLPFAWVVIVGKASVNIVGIELCKWFFVWRKR